MRRRHIVKTNLETATPEQKDRLINNAVEAYKILYNSVVERRIREILEEIKK